MHLRSESSWQAEDPNERPHRTGAVRGWRVSPLDALLQMASCVEWRWLVAAIDSARCTAQREALLDEVDVARLRELLPAHLRSAVDRSDPRSETAGETFVRLAAEDAGLRFEPNVRVTDRYRIDGPLDRTLLEKAILNIAERHEILRTHFEEEEGELLQVVKEASGFQLDPRVLQHEPLGFHDYNCLQMNAFCVVSDSGTLPEESSFFGSVGHPFPAVCIRTSTERPEALDKACFILAGIDKGHLLQAVDTAVQMNLDGDFGIPVPDYVEENVSTKVVKIIQSYTGVVDKMVWRKY